MYIRETQSADWFKDGIFCWGRTESTRKVPGKVIRGWILLRLRKGLSIQRDLRRR
jgi:hypothetical protein